MEADGLDPANIFDKFFQNWSSGFDQLRANLLKEISSPLRREGRDQMLFGGGEDSLEADHEKVINEMSADVFGAASHVFLLET